MLGTLWIVLTYPFSIFRPRQDLALKVLALRHQLMVLKRQTRRPRHRRSDRSLSHGNPIPRPMHLTRSNGCIFHSDGIFATVMSGMAVGRRPRLVATVSTPWSIWMLVSRPVMASRSVVSVAICFSRSAYTPLMRFSTTFSTSPALSCWASSSWRFSSASALTASGSMPS